MKKNTDFYAECWGERRGGDLWAYGKVVSGRHEGRRGWIAADYVRAGYAHGD
ncbi:hypothetical protein [Streptomyces sp. NPDC059009]|uniref:hypothetical protein n=1 Tax=Streptomyces sp. NPDC059009 TaxID=3346694 RepID=UPI003678B365